MPHETLDTACPIVVQSLLIVLITNRCVWLEIDAEGCATYTAQGYISALKNIPTSLIDGRNIYVSVSGYTRRHMNCVGTRQRLVRFEHLIHVITSQ